MNATIKHKRSPVRHMTLFILLLGFNIYCENAREIEARRAEEREQYCDNARKELDEVTRPKVREIYERDYQQGSCTENNDCVGIEPLRNCDGNGRGTGCNEIFYRNLEEQFKSETHDMNEKCKSYYDFCRSIWPLDVIADCAALTVRCVESQCMNTFF